MKLVETEGGDALTMRRLAADLNVATTTIYWHVGGRDELVLAVIKRLSDLQSTTAITGDTPLERILCVATKIWSNALNHRNITALAHQSGATSLLGLPMEIAMAQELNAAGVHGAQARDALRAILSCVAGFLVVGFRSTAIESEAASQATRQIQPQVLWSEVTDTGIDAATLAAMRVSPKLNPLFQTTMRAVIGAFLPSSADAIATSSTPEAAPTTRRANDRA